jgi:hypothetical protein
MPMQANIGVDTSVYWQQLVAEYRPALSHELFIVSSVRFFSDVPSSLSDLSNNPS